MSQKIACNQSNILDNSSTNKEIIEDAKKLTDKVSKLKVGLSY